MLYEDSLLILPDGKTIVGVNGQNDKTLIIEDITTNKATTFGKHEFTIQTLLYHKVTRSLFAGDFTGHVKQYKQSRGDLLFSLVKDYGDAGIGSLYSCAQVGGFGVFGGRHRSFVAIDILERRVCEGNLKSPFNCTYSLQVCHGLNQKVYLSLAGSLPSKSSTISDFLDVTELYNYKKEFRVLNEKQMQCFKGEVEKVKKSNDKDSL